MGKQKEIWKICAIAISPTNDKVAFYNRNRKSAYLFNADFEGEYRVVYFDCDNSPHYEEFQDFLNLMKEMKIILKYVGGVVDNGLPEVHDFLHHKKLVEQYLK